MWEALRAKTDFMKKKVHLHTETYKLFSSLQLLESRLQHQLLPESPPSLLYGFWRQPLKERYLLKFGLLKLYLVYRNKRSISLNLFEVLPLYPCLCILPIHTQPQILLGRTVPQFTLKKCQNFERPEWPMQESVQLRTSQHLRNTCRNSVNI